MPVPAKERMRLHRQRKTLNGLCKTYNLTNPCLVYDFMEAKKDEMEKLLKIHIERVDCDFNLAFFDAMRGFEVDHIQDGDTRWPVYPVDTLNRKWHDMIPKFCASHNVYEKE